MGCYGATTLCVNSRTVLGEAVYSLTKCGNMGALSGSTYAPFGYGLVAMQDVTASYGTKALCVSPYLWLSSGPDQGTGGVDTASFNDLTTRVSYAETAVIALQSTTAPPVLSVEDGVTLGWLVGSAFIAVFCVKFIVRALRGESGGDYGKS